jgi:NitT/TauT family transport system substrate-binding protein
MHGMKESELKVLNTSDSISVLPSSPIRSEGRGDLNPMVMTIEQTPGWSKIFDSSKIPARSSTCSSSTPKFSTRGGTFCRSLVGAWYEVMRPMAQRGPEADKADGHGNARTLLNEYKAQLRTTAMF